MSRLTISLPDDLHRALKEESARRARTIGDLVAESLALYGIKPREEARAILARARALAGLSDERAVALAVEETRAARRETLSG